MYNQVIQAYSRNPVNKYLIESPTIFYKEENRSCGDNITVYLVIENNFIKEASFEGNTSIIATACASIFLEDILEKNIQEIFTFTYSHIVELIGMEISPRRKRASVLGLLSVRNALHEFLSDGMHDDFSDVIPEN